MMYDVTIVKDRNDDKSGDMRKDTPKSDQKQKSNENTNNNNINTNKSAKPKKKSTKPHTSALKALKVLKELKSRREVIRKESVSYRKCFLTLMSLSYAPKV